MREKWTGEIVGKLHILNITQKELADELGVTKEYVSMLLTGARSTQDAEPKMLQAIENIKHRRASQIKEE